MYEWRAACNNSTPRPHLGHFPSLVYTHTMRGRAGEKVDWARTRDPLATSLSHFTSTVCSSSPLALSWVYPRSTNPISLPLLAGYKRHRHFRYTARVSYSFPLTQTSASIYPGRSGGTGVKINDSSCAPFSCGPYGTTSRSFSHS